jgi:hypothetical protein
MEIYLKYFNIISTYIWRFKHKVDTVTGQKITNPTIFI